MSTKPQRVVVIKAILFDMDATLLDTEALSDKAILLAFGPSLPKTVFLKAPMSDYRLPWELKKQILGLRGTEWAPIVLSYAKENWEVSDENENENENKSISPPPTPLDFCKNWEESLNSMCKEITACAGAIALVEAFAKTTGLPMAIATSSRYTGVSKKRVRHENIFQHINAIVAGDDPAVKNGKPAPDIYIEAARRLGVDPKDCLVFEDALSGVRSGKAAGCHVAAIPDPRFSDEEKKVFVQEADVVLSDLYQFDGSQFGIDVNMTQYSISG